MIHGSLHSVFNDIRLSAPIFLKWGLTTPNAGNENKISDPSSRIDLLISNTSSKYSKNKRIAIAITT